MYYIPPALSKVNYVGRESFEKDPKQKVFEKAVQQAAIVASLEVEEFDIEIILSLR